MKSQRLRLRDIRGVYRLLGEISEWGEDARVWRTHLLQSLRKTFDATVAFTLDMSNATPGQAPTLIEPVDLGWRTDHERRLWLGYIQHGGAREDPAAIALFTSLQSRSLISAGREQMVDDPTWYGSPCVSEGRRSSDIDYICSAARIAPGMVHGFIFYRPWGAGRFGRRQRDHLRLLHFELLRLMRSQPPQGREELPPRLIQVLALLQRGASAKDIAEELGLRLHTVNSYLKQLYRRLGVAGRSELLARRAEELRRPHIALPGREGMPIR